MVVYLYLIFLEKNIFILFFFTFCFIFFSFLTWTNTILIGRAYSLNKSKKKLIFNHHINKQLSHKIYF
jgi:hypothetical protein